VRLFEIGSKVRCHRRGAARIEMLAAVATGTRWPEQWGSAREALILRCQADVETCALDGRRGIDSIPKHPHWRAWPGTRCTSFTGGQVDRLSGRNASTLGEALTSATLIFF